MDLKCVINSRHTSERVYSPTGISPTLQANKGGTSNKSVLIACGQTKSTNMPAKLTEKTMEEESYMKETSQQSKQKTSQNMTSWLEDFLAKHSQLQVNAQDLMTQEEHSFLRLQGFSGTKHPDVFYSKTLKVYYLITLEGLSKQYLKYSPTLGIELNGRYLILKTSEFHRTGKECSLSDILEDKVEDKYFLSEKQTGYIKNNMHKVSSSTALISHTTKGGATTGKEQCYEQTSRTHNPKGISPTVPTASGGRHIPMICESEDSRLSRQNDSKDFLIIGLKKE